MARHDLDDPPPYAIVAVHTLPPLKSYEEVVYGVGPGLTPPSFPQYVPQYVPSVVTTQVTQPSKPPSKKRSRLCQGNAQCYGGSGGILLVLGLLALAVWLGVRYGTRLAVAEIYNNQQQGRDNEFSSSPKHDTCPNNTVQCDGISDCQMGTDETNCVRFAANGGLQVKTSKDGRFLPVCFFGWDKSAADRTCHQLGFRKSYITKAITPQESSGLALTSSPTLLIQSVVEVISSCLDRETVFLQCVDCGRQQAASRIIGGSKVNDTMWPWQVSLHFRGSHTCGGTLISPDFVLTAAHCFPSTNSLALSEENWLVYAGVLDLKNLNKPYLVKRIMLSENYDSGTNDHDLALLKLTEPVEFSAKVAPACLPAFDQQFLPGAKCYTTGFGTTEAGSGTISNYLNEVSVNLIDTQVCNKLYGGAVTKNMLCAGDLNGGRDSCQGDSGGPLVCQSENRWYVMGITSWGAGCGERNNPGVYTNVKSVLPWIYSTMQLKRP